MRFIFSWILIGLTYGCSQDKTAETRLTGKHWFVQAHNWETERTAVFSTDSTLHHEWEAQFYPNGKMFYAAFFPLNFRDANGNFHLKGERFIDTLYTYAIKDNIMKVTKAEEVYYLKFMPKNNGEFIITPALEKDFE